MSWVTVTFVGKTDSKGKSAILRTMQMTTYLPEHTQGTLTAKAYRRAPAELIDKTLRLTFNYHPHRRP